jgi:hypothetical protein
VTVERTTGLQGTPERLAALDAEAYGHCDLAANVRSLVEYAQGGESFGPDDAHEAAGELAHLWDWCGGERVHAGPVSLPDQITCLLRCTSARVLLNRGLPLEPVELAALANVSTQTLRWYQGKGLLPKGRVFLADVARWFLASRCLGADDVSALRKAPGVRWSYQCGAGTQWLRVQTLSLPAAVLATAVGWVRSSGGGWTTPRKPVSG